MGDQHDVAAAHAVRVQILTCARCDLVKQCRHPVPFKGPTPARVAVIGEAPGAVENEVGMPFVGPAGILLRRELDMVGIDVAEVFFANAVSCYPAETHTPTPHEVQTCSHNLARQLGLASAEHVLVVGRVAQSALDWPEMARLLGFRYWSAPHPAAALRNPAYQVELRGVIRALAEVMYAPVYEAFGVGAGAES